MSEIQHLRNIFHLQIFFWSVWKLLTPEIQQRETKLFYFDKLAPFTLISFDYINLLMWTFPNVLDRLHRNERLNNMYLLIREVDRDIHCTVNGANETKKEPLDEDNNPYNTECIIRCH